MNFEPKDILTLDKMITPTIIQVLYWIGLVFAVLAGVVTLLMGLVNASFTAVITGLIWLVLGPVFVRIYCEILIVLFNIYGSLQNINETLQAREPRL